MHDRHTHHERSAPPPGRAARTLTGALFAVGTALVATLAIGANTSQAQVEGPPLPDSCPAKWKLAVPPLNPVLRCVPDFVQSATKRRGPTGGCPPNWKQPRPPLNPALGCVPGFVATAVGSQRGPSHDCPPMWKKAQPPFRCLPAFLTSDFFTLPTDEGPSSHPVACPDGWKVPPAPFNQQLGCVPDFIKSVIKPTHGPSGVCPPMWKKARPPLNPALGCVPDFLSSAVDSQRGPSPGCPPKWKPVFRPLNPALKCVPGFVATAVQRV